MKVHKNSTLILLVLSTAILALCAACSPSDTPATVIVGSSPGGGSTAVANLQVSAAPAAIANSGTTTVTATVTNSSGGGVSGVTVNFTVSNPAAGNFAPASTTTNASGVASVTFTANAAVDAMVTIMATVTTATGTLSSTASLTIGTPPRVPTSVVIALGAASIPQSGSTTVNATVTDAVGGISGVSVSFTISDATAGSLSGGSAVTNASGIATVSFTANAVDATITVRATVGTLNDSDSLIIGAGGPPPTPVSMTFTANPLQISISNQSSLTVTLLAAGGIPADNNPVTLAFVSGATLGSLSQTNLITDTLGVATATFTAGASSGTVTIRATSGILTQTVSINITSDPASMTVTAANPNLTSGQTTNITADVRNILNNPVSDGTTVNFAITAGATTAGALSSPTATTVNGIATVTFTADLVNAGSLIITASAGTAPVVSATTLVSVGAAQAGSIQFVSATPNIIGIVGSGTQDSSAVKFLVLNTAGAPLGSQSVNFTLFGPYGATLDAGGLTTSSGSTDVNGEVTTVLHAGALAGPARIVASTTVPGPPPFTIQTSSGNIAIGGGVPSDRFFDVSVSQFNLDGLNCNGVTSTLGAWIADRFGNYNILEGTTVSFVTDSGAVNTFNSTGPDGTTTSVFRTQAPRPADVAPNGWETAAGLFYVDGTGRTRNPRDGWATVLVRTTGEEHFVDNNANGVYDVGETFTDLPESFVDSDDSLAHEAGELYFDWPTGVSGNPNFSYDGVNSAWDPQITIFRNVNLVFTGSPVFGPNTSRIVNSALGTGPVLIPYGSSATFYAYVSDVNMNTPIGGTTISVTTDKTEANVIGGDATIPDALSYGPYILFFRVVNNNSSGNFVYPQISAEITWPGICAGTVTYPPMYYPGLVTLAPAPPATPTGLTAQAGGGAGEIDVTWNSVTGAVSYNLYWGIAPGATTNVIPGATSPYVHTGRLTGTTYYYAVTAVNAAGESAKSAEVSAVAP